MATVLGWMHLYLHVPQARSLKDKRRIVKGFKDRITHRFNVSVAEVDGLETYRRATLAVGMVGNDRTYVQGALEQIARQAGTHKDMLLYEQTIEWW